MGIQQIIFAFILFVSFVVAYTAYSSLYRNIKLGKDFDPGGHEGERWKNVLLIAFGQKKMFKRWIPGLLHFFIYAAFLITQIELIEIMIDGLFGTHRLFAPYLGGLYTFTISFIEILSVLALFATVIFLIRRNILKLPRFTKVEMTGWPFIDANLILFGEIALVAGIFMMNGADIVLQQVDPEHYHQTGFFAISGWLGPMLFDGLGKNILELIERSGWWLHLITVLLFLNYLRHSKHLHIFLAFPNVFFTPIKSRGEMENMPSIMNEVKSMMGLASDTSEELSDEDLEFGANDVFGLSWKNILESYTCTECGRCTDVCPANTTGKVLSPRKIMMDVRDRADEVGCKIDEGKERYMEEGLRGKGEKLSKANFNDGKSLFDYISREEIHACTTCNACVEACPVLLNPLDIILKMRRYEILTESAGPQEWLPMFTSLENSGSVWQIPDDRDAWSKSE